MTKPLVSTGLQDRVNSVKNGRDVPVKKTLGIRIYLGESAKKIQPNLNGTQDRDTML